MGDDPVATTVSTYDHLSRDQLIARLKVAEDVCVMVGWSSTTLGDPSLQESQRVKAAQQMWHIWASMVDPEFRSPDAHPDLVRMKPQLARRRDEIEARFRRIADLITEQAGTDG